MSSLVCAIARPFVVAGAFDGEPLNPRIEAHRNGCLRCQAAEARARTTGRTLHGLGHGPVDPPTDLSGAVVGGLDAVTDQPVTVGRSLAFGLLVASATVVVMLRRRRR